jgi:hypothetical protein
MTVRGTILPLTVTAIFAACTTEKLPPLAAAPTTKVNLAQLEPGVIVITSSSDAAAISVDPPNGRMESASEGAADAARSVLNTPDLGHNQLEAAVGVVGFAVAPFAAAYGAISASQQRLSPDKLSEAQQELMEAMKSKASPETLLQLVSEIARQKTRRLLICAGCSSNSPAGEAPVSAVLNVIVEQLRLRVDKPNGSQYVLSIDAHARLERASDGRVLLQRAYHYESGPGLFIDWTRLGGLEGVARTGYRSLAEQIANDVFVPAFERPILIVPEQPGPSSSSTRGVKGMRKVRQDFLVDNPSIRFIRFLQAEIGSMEVHTGSADDRLRLQGPQSQSGSGSPAGTSDTEWAMDGLANNRNSVVQGLSCLAAVPMGIWEQTFGVINKRSRDKSEKLETVLSAATAQAHFERDLADEVASCLQSRAADSIVRADAPLRFALSTQPEAGGPGSTGRDIPATCKTALEIQVVNTKLVGKHRNSQSRALLVEVQATVYRTSDGQELYSRSIVYRSSEKRLKDWAAFDAKQFRKELDTCSRRSAKALTSDLIRRGFVTPLQGR